MSASVSRDYLHAGYQMTRKSNEGLVLFFRVSHEPKSLFPGVWWHKGWLSVTNRGLSSKVEESLSGVVFSIDEISRLQSVLPKVFVSLEHTVKRLLYQNMVNFDRSN